MSTGAERRKRAAKFAGSVWQQYGTGLQQFLVRRLRHSHNAQDLAQEIYLRILRFGSKELVRDPQAYLYRIASHVVYEFKMKAGRERVVFDSQLLDREAANLADPSTVDPLEERLGSERELQALLERLPPTCKMVFVLRKRDGLSYGDIAEKLSISPHTVKKYMFRAGAELRAMRWPDREAQQ